MSFVSLEFIIFVIASLALYYLMPLKIRWIALLIMSYAFYMISGGVTVAYLLFTTITVISPSGEIANVVCRQSLPNPSKTVELALT